MTANELVRALIDSEAAGLKLEVALWHEGTRLEPIRVHVDLDRRLAILHCVER